MHTLSTRAEARTLKRNKASVFVVEGVKEKKERKFYLICCRAVLFERACTEGIEIKVHIAFDL